MPSAYRHGPLRRPAAPQWGQRASGVTRLGEGGARAHAAGSGPRGSLQHSTPLRTCSAPPRGPGTAAPALEGCGHGPQGQHARSGLSTAPQPVSSFSPGAGENASQGLPQGPWGDGPGQPTVSGDGGGWGAPLRGTTYGGDGSGAECFSQTP